LIAVPVELEIVSESDWFRNASRLRRHESHSKVDAILH
jgi:hypothetical protein